MKPSRLAVLAIVLSVPVAILAWRYPEMPTLGLIHDDSVYFVTGKAIAAGHGYRVESLPVDLAQTKYPPVLPVLLSMVWAANPSFPGNLPVAMIAALIPLPLCLWLTGLHARGYGFSLLETTAAMTIVAGAANTIYLSTTVLSEIWFTAFALAAVLLAERPGAALQAGIAGAAMLMTRIAGLPFLLTAPLVLTLRRRRRDAAVVVVTGAASLAGWSLWTSSRPLDLHPYFAYYSAGGYTRILESPLSLSDLAAMIGFNSSMFLMSVGDLVFFGLPNTMPGRFCAPVLLVAAVSGLVRAGRETGRWQLPLLAAGTAAMLVIWIYPPTARLTWPLLPAVALGIVREVRQFVASAPKSLVLKAAVALVAALWLKSAAWACLLWYPSNAELNLQYNGRVLPVYAAVRQIVPEDESLLAYRDVLLYLHTGRRAVRPWLDPAAWFRDNMKPNIDSASNPVPFMRANRIGWLLATPADYHMELSPEDRDEVLRRVRALPDLEPVYDKDGFVLFRLKAEAR